MLATYDHYIALEKALAHGWTICAVGNRTIQLQSPNGSKPIVLIDEYGAVVACPF